METIVKIGTRIKDPITCVAAITELTNNLQNIEGVQPQEADESKDDTDELTQIYLIHRLLTQQIPQLLCQYLAQKIDLDKIIEQTENKAKELEQAFLLM